MTQEFPASAGPWLVVSFETVSAAARFANNVRKVTGYRATVDSANPRKVVTNAERWQISEVVQKTKTRSQNAPLRIEVRTSRDFDKAALMRSIDADQKKAAQAKVLDLRKRIREAVLLLRRSRGEGQSFCRKERARASERVKKLRLRLRQEANRLAVLERQKARFGCGMTRKDVRALRMQVQGMRRELREEKRFQAEMRRIAAGNRTRTAPRSTTKERRGESDDEVRQNIPRELHPLFNRVRRSIKGGPRVSRTEAFMRYAEEHPGEEFAGIEDKTEALVRSLERQQRTGRRDPGASSAGRARRRRLSW